MSGGLGWSRRSPSTCPGPADQGGRSHYNEQICGREMGKTGYVVKKWERKVGSIDELRKQAQDKQAHDKYCAEQFKCCGQRLNWRHSEMLFIFLF